MTEEEMPQEEIQAVPFIFPEDAETVTYDSLLTPQVKLTASNNPETGRLQYRAEITVLGVDIYRTTTAEERVAGILSLENPITVQETTHRALIDLAKRAVPAAVQGTPGQELDIVHLVALEYLVARGVRGALRKLERYPVDI